MHLRAYTAGDFPELYRLFWEAVHTVNAADYAPTQLAAWAPGKPDAARWEASLAAHYSLIAEEDGQILGFADLDPGVSPEGSCTLDRLYLRSDCRGRGIASVLAAALERRARELGAASVVTEASITARPFFEKRGYAVVREQRKPLRGEIFCNYVMQKSLR